jgi:hypothetical protein
MNAYDYRDAVDVYGIPTPYIRGCSVPVLPYDSTETPFAYKDSIQLSRLQSDGMQCIARN